MPKFVRFLYLAFCVPCGGTVLFQQIYEQHDIAFPCAVCGGVSGYAFGLRAVFTDEKVGAWWSRGKRWREKVKIEDGGNVPGNRMYEEIRIRCGNIGFLFFWKI